jgi:predicted alpha/beta superfamily hydrolase
MKFLFYGLSICVLLFGCKNSPQIVDPIPIHTSFTIDSKKVGEIRTINVWTPSEYKTSTDSLPVMYMADGGIKEDFPHIANTLAKLIKEKKIGPIILVGIENTQRRRDLSGPTEVETDKEVAPVVGGSENFRAFINDELFSEIEKRYRTTNKKGILGESLSGLFVMETLYLKPEMFDYYIAFDPSLWWNNHYLVRIAKEKLNNLPASEKKLWFAGSSATDISQYTNELSKILTDSNPKNMKWSYSDEPKEKHSTIFRATKEKALIWTLNIK